MIEARAQWIGGHFRKWLLTVNYNGNQFKNIMYADTVDPNYFGLNDLNAWYIFNEKEFFDLLKNRRGHLKKLYQDFFNTPIQLTLF
jgi:hypothetical protein